MARPTSASPDAVEQEYFFPEYGKVVVATSQEEALKLVEADQDQTQPASPINEDSQNG